MLIIVDYKKVEMTEDEKIYYDKIVEEFTNGGYSGKEEFRDVFDVDADGCISMIRPPLKKEVPWVVLVFLQNLMINQRLGRMERWCKEKLNGR
jgi:hypothetical protein